MSPSRLCASASPRLTLRRFFNASTLHRISLADTFAAALARGKKGELISGDPAFRPLENEIKIAWLREDK
ncbi:MAG: hypothetical protein L0Y58_25185 [Verrucomicrobia subdivision 3 bacterium]|nr:hypothetical protein [Limisphaerales bacterium]